MNITFIGNCQTLSLCFYFQKMLDDNYYVSWIASYKNAYEWGSNLLKDRVKNKIFDYDEAINIIKKSDIIIWQNIIEGKSKICNSIFLSSINNKCRLIQLPSIYLIYDNFDNSIKELITRENKNKVDIKVSDIFLKFRDKNLMLTKNHPNTFLFMEVIKKLCQTLNFNFFSDNDYNNFLKDNNFVKLPL